MTESYKNNPAVTCPISVDCTASDEVIRATLIDLLAIVLNFEKSRLQDLSFIPISGGITNRLYVVRWNKDTESVVVRVFGAGTDLFIDRSLENTVFANLSLQNFGPQFLGLFSNGRVESYIDARSLQPEEMSQAIIFPFVSTAIASLHTVEINEVRARTSKTRNDDFWLWKKINQFFDLVIEAQAVNEVFAHKIQSIDVPAMRKELLLLKETIQKLGTSHENTSLFDDRKNCCIQGKIFALQEALNHNDMLCGNILISNGFSNETSTEKNPITLIDYEYAAYNYRAYDIANHFCEFGGFDFNLERSFPPEDIRRAFVKHYLSSSSTYYRELSKDEDKEEFENGFHVVLNLLLLASHLFWGTWSLVQASISTLDFDYAHYAILRYEGTHQFFMKHSSPSKIKMKTVRLMNGLNIAYREWGKPSSLNPFPIIAHHGWLDNCNTFNYLGEYFGNKGYHFIALDAAGHGYSDHLGVGASYSSMNLAVFLGDFFDALSVQNAYLLGHSMGANISVLFAATHPEKVKKLIAIEGFGPLVRPATDTLKNFRAALDNQKSMFHKINEPGYKLKEYKTIQHAVDARLKAVTFYPGKQYIRPEAAAQIIARGTKSVASQDSYEDLLDPNHGPVVFRHDPRLVLPNMFYYTQDQIKAIMDGITAKTLLITAVHGWPFDPIGYEERKTILQDKNLLTHTILEGSHHLHLDPDTALSTATCIEDFLTSEYSLVITRKFGVCQMPTKAEEGMKKSATVPRATRGRVGRPSNAQLQEKQAQLALLAQQNQINAAMKKNEQQTAETSSESKTEAVKNEEEDANVDIHPFSVGHSLVVRYRDGSNRLAKIIERTEIQDVGKENNWRYYIHYNDFNRRMDEWIDNSRIISLPSVANRLQKNQNKLDQKQQEAADDNKLSTVADIEHDEHEGLDEASLLEHEKVTRVKNIHYVQLGKYIMECWYFSPFPREYFPNGFTEYIYFCEFSMRFFRTKQELIRYQTKSPLLNRYPPGNEIYRDDTNAISMFEIDGAIEKIYCQNLCYLAKLFLDHKTLYWDVDVFLFYVLCVRDERGFHPVGYFSKEKYSELGYNLACILTFPCYQRKGYGRFLIEFSYELSKKEEKVGSPEKPLSDLGAVGFRSYWANTILKLLKQQLYGNNTSDVLNSETKLSILDITLITSILPEDVVTTLVMLNILIPKQSNDSASEISKNANNNNNNKENENSSIHVIENIQDYIIYAPLELLEKLLQKYPENQLKVDSTKLHWAPFYVMDNKKDKWTLLAMKASIQQAALTVPTTQNTITDTTINESEMMDVDTTTNENEQQ